MVLLRYLRTRIMWIKLDFYNLFNQKYVGSYYDSDVVVTQYTNSWFTNIKSVDLYLKAKMQRKNGNIPYQQTNNAACCNFGASIFEWLRWNRICERQLSPLDDRWWTNLKGFVWKGVFVLDREPIGNCCFQAMATWKTVLYSLGLFSLCFLGVPVTIHHIDDVETLFKEFTHKYNRTYINNPSEYSRRLEYFRVTSKC